jgi:hypothetical protein
MYNCRLVFETTQQLPFCLIKSARASAGMTLLAPESKIEWVIYDSDRTITLQGKDFEWVNRRSWLRVVANDERTGRQVLWTFGVLRHN